MSRTSSLKVEVDRRLKKRDKKIDRTKIIKGKTPLQRIFGYKDHLKDHYFSQGSKVSRENCRDVLEEPSPFKSPEDLDQFAYKAMSKLWIDTERRQELAQKYNQRNTYATRQRGDILKRLYVHTEDVKSAKTILDIDSEFYSLVEGRPVSDKFNLIDYIDNLREVLRTKIVTGYKMDDALLIEENLLEEQNMINEITKQYNTYAGTFEEYLSKDHTTSMALLRQSELEATKSYEKYEAYRQIAKEFGSLKSQVTNLEEKWSNCKMYQKFLYLVSPMHWRKEHDFENRIYKADGTFELTEHVATTDLIAGSNVRSMEIIDAFLKQCESEAEPLLYFQRPYELLKVFKYIELQNLTSLLHSEELAVPLERIKDSMAAAEEDFNKKITDLQENIDNLEGEILWEEERASALEALARELINGEFKSLICDESTLNLQVIVEDVYEARVTLNDANLSALDMMKAIEIKYRELLLALDYLPFNRVKIAEKECYTEESKVMKVAMEAARKVLQIERLVKRLRTILEPPKDTHVKALKQRSMLHHPKVQELHVEQPISKEEAEYFYLFTDFCEGVDDIKKYREARKRDLELEEQVIAEQSADEIMSH